MLSKRLYVKYIEYIKCQFDENSYIRLNVEYVYAYNFIFKQIELLQPPLNEFDS